MTTQIIIGVFLGALGILFVILGARAIRKMKITLGDPGISDPHAQIFWPDDKKYTDRKAVIAGWCFVIFGIILVLSFVLMIIWI
jgi:hypothetical protein